MKGGAAFLLLCAAGLAGTVTASHGLVPVVQQTLTVRAILAAEDSRTSSPEVIAPVIESAEHGSPTMRAMAVRALGRLEQPALVDVIQGQLGAGSPAVRAEAANALAQAVSREAGSDSVGAVREVLLDRFGRERDGVVRGVIAEALGRLPFDEPAHFRRVEEVLREAIEAGQTPNVGLSPGSPPRTPWGTPVAGVTLGFDARPAASAAVQVLGAVKGLESLARRNRKLAGLGEETIRRLRELVTSSDLERLPGGRGIDRATSNASLRLFAGDATARTRRLAMGALIAAGGAELNTVRQALRSDDWELRRLALQALTASAERSASHVLAVLQTALADRVWQVRYEALGVYAQHRATAGCGPLLRAAEQDRNGHVAIRAIDLLDEKCAGENVQGTLERLTGTLPAVAEGRSMGGTVGNAWHKAAHAIVALARVAPPRARERWPSFAAHPVWQVRMYAARAAAALGATDRLEALATDSHPNVREAAIGGLVRTAGHAAEAHYLDALAANDYQLVRTAAMALQGNLNGRDALPELFEAVRRITRQRRDTSRDPRLAILDRIAEFGSAAEADSLRPYLSDFDPLVARRAAAILSVWSGQSEEPRPEPLLPTPLPSAEELEALGRSVARVEMERLGTFEMELLVSEAPVTAARFARLAREGYYDGLSFHRVVPNFVIQGGSPGANEYMGDGPYLRDEVGLAPHVRGAVGISTRGRDTGDAQIFIDLVDNPRLDHQYSVFARVTRGMEQVVDGILEGEVIEKIEIVEK